jgi:hypothetical protein
LPTITSIARRVLEASIAANLCAYCQRVERVVLPRRSRRSRPVELGDDPVDVVRDLEALRLEDVVVLEAGVEAAQGLRPAGVGQPPVPQRLRDLPLRREADAFDRRRAPGEELERVARDLGRIVAPQAAGDRVARVRERLVAARDARRVQLREPLARHQHLAAHLEPARHGAACAVEGQRDVPDRPQIRGDVLAPDAVPAGRAPHESPVDVEQRSARAVELGLDDPLELLPGRQAEETHDAVRELAHLLRREQALDREHRHLVDDRREALALGQRRPDAARRAVLGRELGVALLELAELPEQRVVLRVGDLRPALDVVQPIVPPDLREQGLHALGRGSRGGHGLNGERRPSGEPAGPGTQNGKSSSSSRAAWPAASPLPRHPSTGASGSAEALPAPASSATALSESGVLPGASPIGA